MNKSQLVERLSQRLGLPFKTADRIVRIIFESITEALKREERIEIRGFGSFVVKKYDPYTGRNPKTGEKIPVPAKRIPFFKAGKELKERVDYPRAD